MESCLEADQIVITLTEDECLRLANGESLTDRNNPFDPSAKVDIRQLTDLDPNYIPLPITHQGFNERLGGTACQAYILGNNDIIVYVPREVVSSTYVAAEDISVDVIHGERSVIPEGGIRIEFGEIVGPNNRRYSRDL